MKSGTACGSLWRKLRSHEAGRNRAGISENGVAQKRMHTSQSFRGIEGGRTGGDAVRSERGLSGLGNGLLRERVRLESGVVIESEVSAFVPFHENQDASGFRAC
jgi:hypothetical protein